MEIRACDVGQSVPALKELKGFFGCSVICAPTKKDSYVPINSGIPGPGFDRLLAKHPGVRVTGDPPHRFALSIHGNADMPIADAFAESSKGVKDWMEKHLPKGYKQDPTDLFPTHGFFVKSGFVLAGEPGFVSNLTSV